MYEKSSLYSNIIILFIQIINQILHNQSLILEGKTPGVEFRELPTGRNVSFLTTHKFYILVGRWKCKPIKLQEQNVLAEAANFPSIVYVL